MTFNYDDFQAWTEPTIVCAHLTWHTLAGFSEFCITSLVKTVSVLYWYCFRLSVVVQQFDIFPLCLVFLADLAPVSFRISF